MPNALEDDFVAFEKLGENVVVFREKQDGEEGELSDDNVNDGDDDSDASPKRTGIFQAFLQFFDKGGDDAEDECSDQKEIQNPGVVSFFSFWVFVAVFNKQVDGKCDNNT